MTMKWLAPLALLCGCASVLGVDKTYELGDAAAGDTGTSDAAGQDAGADADAGGADGADTGTGEAAPGQIRCNAGASCPSSSEECCLASDASLACASTAVGDPCPLGTDIACDDPSDCPGAACCMALQTDQSLLGTTCEATCQAGEIPLCAPGGAACAQGSCVAVPVKPDPPFTTPWFYGCQ